MHKRSCNVTFYCEKNRGESWTKIIKSAYIFNERNLRIGQPKYNASNQAYAGTPR